MPLREFERLKQVNRYLALEIDKKNELNQIVRMAAEICNTPVALITILDDETQFIKFQIGFDVRETDKEDAFCQYAIQQYDVMEVTDALQDARFVKNPLVVGEPGIRFYAGAPLTTQDGHNLGSLCVIDQQPGKLTETQHQILRMLSRQVIQILEFELSINVLKEQFIKAKASEIKLRSFFESSASCHLLLGKNFEVLAYNKSLSNFIEDLYGVTIQEGMDIRDYVSPSHLPAFIENYGTALSGKAVVSEQEIDYIDKRIYWYITYEPACTKEGEIIGVSHNATDVTDRVSQQRLVLAQNKSLKKIAFIQSHELRRPVSSILGLMEMIKTEEYYQGQQELLMLDVAVKELDGKIRDIVNHTF